MFGENRNRKLRSNQYYLSRPGREKSKNRHGKKVIDKGKGGIKERQTKETIKVRKVYKREREVCVNRIQKFK